VRQVVGGIGLCRPDIFRGYVRMAFNNLLDAIAGAKKAEDVFDRNARARNDGLAEHNFRVAFNPGVLHRFLALPFNISMAMPFSAKLTSLRRPARRLRKLNVSAVGLVKRARYICVDLKRLLALEEENQDV
jgi:hypothetical protein